MAKVNFSKKEALNYGYNTTKKNLKFFIILLVIAFAIYIAASSIQNSFNQSMGEFAVLAIIVSILVWIVNVILEMGLIRVSLDFIDKNKSSYGRLFSAKSLFNYLVVSIIRSIIVAIGIILLIIPGIILAIKLQYATYLIVDKNAGIGESLRGTWEMTKGVKWNLFLFGLLIALINIGGAILILIGLFFTVPLTLLANAFVYRKLLPQITRK